MSATYTADFNYAGSRAIYPEGARLSDDNLIMIAKQGYLEMENDWIVRNVGKSKRPSVMTALLVDNEVFLASSGKFGQYYFGVTLADEEVNGGLRICQSLILDERNNDGKKHNNRGNCGEQVRKPPQRSNATLSALSEIGTHCSHGLQFAVHFYYTTHPQAGKTLHSRADNEEARIVTVERRLPGDEMPGKLCVKDPCATKPGDPQDPELVTDRFLKFGCDAFNQAQKLRTIVPPEKELCDDRDVSGLRPTRTTFFTFQKENDDQEPQNNMRGVALARRKIRT